MRLDPQKVQPGQALPEVSHAIDRLDLIRYAGASGDFNPIHWNDEYAKAAGLPGVIAHGMFSMGVAARVVTAFAGDPGAIRRLRVRFSAMIQPGQTLTARGEVAAVDGDRVTIRFWAEDEHGEKVLSKGEAELDVGAAAGA
jgi:acyl dehydratase